MHIEVRELIWYGIAPPGDTFHGNCYLVDSRTSFSFSVTKVSQVHLMEGPISAWCYQDVLASISSSRNCSPLCSLGTVWHCENANEMVVPVHNFSQLSSLAHPILLYSG